MGWLIALCVLIGAAVLPIGISAIYNTGGPKVKVLVGPVRFAVYPRKKKTSDTTKKQTPVRKETTQNKQCAGGSAKDFTPLLHRLLDFLSAAKGKLRVRRLDLKLTLGGDDPCDLAVNYGHAWAAVGNLIPLLERHFVIKKQDVEVQCDFTSNETCIYARLDLTITVGRLLRLGAGHVIPALREYHSIMKLRKGGAKL